MARFLREIPEDVAEQALTHKTVNADALREAAKREDPGVSRDDLILVASDVATPELAPYEYAYNDVYTDGDGTFYVAIKEKYYRRSKQKTINPSG